MKDCISKSAIISILRSKSEMCVGDYAMYLRAVEKMIEAMPAKKADSEGHAHWVYGPGYNDCHCSHCLSSAVYVEETDQNYPTRFCPECGYEMDESSKNNAEKDD